jgi:hypothetical protein
MRIRMQTLGFHPKPRKLFEKSLTQNFTKLGIRFAAVKLSLCRNYRALTAPR